MDDDNLLVRQIKTLGDDVVIDQLESRGVVGTVTEFMLSFLNAGAVDALIKIVNGWLMTRPTAEITLTMDDGEGKIISAKWKQLSMTDARKLLVEHASLNKRIRVKAISSHA